jgi:hypothetical protein
MKLIMSTSILPSNSSELTPELIAFTNVHNLMAQAGSMFAICAWTIVLRCYVRIAILKSFGADDWTMLIAFVCMPKFSLGVFPDASEGFSFGNLYMLHTRGTTRARQAYTGYSNEQGCLPRASEGSRDTYVLRDSRPLSCQDLSQFPVPTLGD